VFLVSSALLVAGLVLGLVTLNAMVAQSSFQVDDLTSKVQQLTRDAEGKQLDVAELTAPARVVRAAERLGLHQSKTGEVQVIHVPGTVAGRGEGGLDTAAAGGTG